MKMNTVIENSIPSRLLALPRPLKALIMVSVDAVMIPFALWCAFVLRLDTLAPDLSHAALLFASAIIFSIPIFAALGLYRAVVRFMGIQVAMAVFQGVSLSVLFLASATFMAGKTGIPRSVFGIYWALAVLYIGGSRFLMRSYFQRVIRKQWAKERVGIYGAGASGVQLLSALMNGREYEPVLFLDDDASLWGRVVRGVPVRDPADLAKLTRQVGISKILLAMPSVSHARRRAILSRLEDFPLHVLTVPGMADLVSGKARVDQIREVEIEDLLGRDAVPPNEQLLDQCVRGKCVMVTGAGGSIGSELCRQILRIGPTRLVVFEISEYNLYRIKQELQAELETSNLDVELVPLLGSVQDQPRMESILRHYGVATVYHAAAYKHVPIVEHNMIEGVRNNIFGTWVAAEAAIRAGVETFVLISTDKAVRPTNVMGATKRFAELVLQGLSKQGYNTRFCMVRFGNVLGSSGSVVPLFREQIRQGGPVTVTHPEIIRYFMTIPEAAQLVIQAGSMGQGGDVFVLDMGEPVRIADLARKMIALMGYEVLDEDHPDGDIEIVYTGLRPGEKLYEELLIGDNVAGTQHPMIMRAEEVALPWETVLAYLRRLEQRTLEQDCEALRSILLETVSGYKPAGDIADRLWIVSSNLTSQTPEKKIASAQQ